MPPVKGPRTSTSTQQRLPFRSVKNPGTKREYNKKGRPKLLDRINEDESLLKLRIPKSLCKLLPSVKKFNGSKKSKQEGLKLATKSHVKKEEVDSEDRKPNTDIIFTGKRKRGEMHKYALKEDCEQKFTGMIWDITFTPSGNILVSTSNGVLLCDGKLSAIKKLENVLLGGGIGILSDVRIVAICRTADTVNIYSPSGVYASSFSAGFSPMGLAVTSQDELVITDSGSKSINVYSLQGSIIKTITLDAGECKFQWPLYPAVDSDDNLYVVDCHAQGVFKFNASGKFVCQMCLNTTPGNMVIRPHGICVGDYDDVFIIDTAIHAVEVFAQEGCFIQSLFPMEECANLKPKVLRVSKQGQLIIGGMTGKVRLLSFINKKETPTFIKHEPKFEPIDVDNDVIVLD